MDEIISAVTRGDASVTYCPASFLPGFEEDALQFDGVPGASAYGIEGRAFIALSETERLRDLGRAIVDLGVGRAVETIDARAMLDIAHAVGTEEVWAFYRAMMAEVFPDPPRRRTRRSAA